MARFKIVNGERVQFTAEEETARDEEERQSVIRTQAKADAEATRKANVASAKTKLQNLGFTIDEIKDAFNI